MLRQFPMNLIHGTENWFPKISEISRPDEERQVLFQSLSKRYLTTIPQRGGE